MQGSAGEEGTFTRTADFMFGTRLPFADARPVGVWLNGRRLDDGEYLLERSGQATFVRAVIPAEQSGDVFFLTVKYDHSPKPQEILEF